MTSNLERMLIRAGVSRFEVSIRHFSGGTEEDYETLNQGSKSQDGDLDAGDCSVRSGIANRSTAKLV
jgi:hypothetical protein